MRLIIIRHGDPDYSIDSLTPKGWRESGLLADRLCKYDIDEIYCSPLGRAKDTAKQTLARLGRDMQTVDWLKEFNYALINDPQDIEKKCIMWDFMPSFWTNKPELYDKDNWINSEIFDGSEVYKAYKSVADGVDEILAKHCYRRSGNMYITDKGNHDTVVFFCHLGVESVILSHLLCTSPSIFLQNFFIAPTSVTTLITEERIKGEVSFRCQSLGDISHLLAGEEEPSFAGRYCETFEDDTRH